MVEHFDVQQNGFLRGLLCGIMLGLPFWIVISILIVLTLPSHHEATPVTDPAGIPLQGTPP
jgi:hypothetical protein